MVLSIEPFSRTPPPQFSGALSTPPPPPGSENPTFPGVIAMPGCFPMRMPHVRCTRAAYPPSCGIDQIPRRSTPRPCPQRPGCGRRPAKTAHTRAPHETPVGVVPSIPPQGSGPSQLNIGTRTSQGSAGGEGSLWLRRWRAGQPVIDGVTRQLNYPTMSAVAWALWMSRGPRGRGETEMAKKTLPTTWEPRARNGGFAIKAP